MFDIQAHDTTAPAPGDLELLQRFINLHEHAPGADSDLAPSREMLEDFLHERGILDRGQRVTDADRETSIELQRALHARARTNLGAGAMTDEDVGVIDGLAERAGLRPHFGHEGPVLVTDAPGIDGAFGRLVAVAFLAELDGSWERLKACASEGCRSVFYDRSKNHSGRWCSMSTCGNRAKVRAWRERHRADAER